MKTFRFIGFALFAILMCLSACSSGGDDPIEPTPKPEVTKSEITIDSSIISNGLSFSNVGGDQSISFTTNENWTLSVASTTSGTTWCTASVTSGSKGTVNVKFTVTENTDYDNRSVSVTIKSGTATKTFTISQKGVDALLVTTDKYEVSQEGGTIEIEVKANISYKMEISEKAKDWIKESSSRALTAYKHKLDIAANEEVEKREGEITFKSGDKVETEKVYQESGKPIILLSQRDYNVSDKGDTISVDIKSNIDFDVKMPDVDRISDEASSRGMSSHILKYIISTNEEYDNRTANIIFFDKNSDLKDTLIIAQAQKDAIIIAKNEYTIDAIGGNLKFEINTNVDFEVSTSIDWIKQNTESRGLEIKPLSFTVSENTADEVREGVISISFGELKQNIKIIQKAKPVFSLSKTEFNIPSEGGEFNIEVSTNGEYSITMPEVDWLTENKSRSTSTYTHIFIASVNETYDVRETEIKFIHKETSEVIKVKVIQSQKDAIIITQNEYSASGKGDTLNIELKTNIDYTISIPDSVKNWISLVQSRSLQIENVRLAISANNTNKTRTANITIKDQSNELCDTLHIKQESAYTYTGDINLNTLNDVENLKKSGYTKIDGNLYIKVSTLQHADNLIEEVTGNVIIDNKELVNLDGLCNLKTIGGNLEFDNYNGTSFEGLYNLVYIGGNFQPLTIKNTKNLHTFEGLEKLEKIEGSFIIEGYDSQTYFLKNFKGLKKLSSIGKDFILRAYSYQFCPDLESFEGLNNLSVIKGDFIIDGNGCSDTFRYLKSFKGLEKLSNIGGDLYIRADGSYGKESFSSFTSFEGLNALTTINGDLHIEGLNNSFKSLSSFKGLNNLKTIDGSLTITGKQNSFNSFNSLEGLNNLTTIEKNLCINSYGALNNLTSFEGLNNLSIIKGDFIINAENTYSISSLNSLSSFKGFTKLNRIEGNFRINAEMKDAGSTTFSVLNSLVNFNGLEALLNIGGNLEIKALGALNSLTSFNGLDNLQSINKDFVVYAKSENYQSSLNSLNSFDGLKKLTSIGGDFHVCSEAYFYHTNNPGNILKKESSSLESLSSFSGLENLATIGKGLIIETKSGCFDSYNAKTYAMSSLKTINELSNLINIGEDLIIKSIIEDYSSSNTATMPLHSINFSNLTNIGGTLDITGKSIDITKLFLGKLKNVGNIFQVKTLSYASFPLIENVGSNFSLNDIYEVESLPILKSVNGDITIHRCLKLYDFCNLEFVLTDFSNTFTVTSCGYNPTKYKILNGECSKYPEE